MSPPPPSPSGAVLSTRRAPPRTAEEIATALIRLLLDVEAGLRPRSHLTALLPDHVRHGLQEQVGRGWPSAVLSARAVAVDGNGTDLVVLVRRGRRVGAFSVRLVRHPGGWRVAALGRPEDNGR